MSNPSTEPDGQWHRFSHLDKPGTAPPEQVMVWAYEHNYEQGVTVAIFDGFTFRVLPSGSDDCHVSHWMTMDTPAAPAKQELEEWEAAVEAAEEAAHPEWYQ